MRTKLNLKGTITLGIPTVAAVVLSLVAGAAQVVNEVVLKASPQWHSYIAIMLVFLAGIGISPLVGTAFRSALHLPPWAAYVISAALAAAILALSTTQMSGGAHAAIAAVVTIFAALGFAPSTIPVVTATEPAHR